MTQPTVVPINVDVSGAQEGASDLQDLQAAMAAVTIGAVALGTATGVASRHAGGILGGSDVQAAAAYQKQLSGLAATSTVTRQSMRGLTDDVNTLTRTLPGGQQQMIATVQATQQLGLSQQNQVGQIRALSAEYTKLAAATGGYAPQMAQQFGDLNREVANLDPSRVARFADVVTTLTAKSGGNPSALLSFAQSISPVAQQAGLGESAILGISSAFTKLGDDGGAAATAVNKIMSDLNESVREGSDQMTAYANATGMTVKQFRALYQANPAAALTKVTTAIGQGGSQGEYLLQTLGLDGVRTQRSLLELSQSGGLGAQIQQAVGAYGNGSTNKAAAASFNNVDDKLQVLTSTMGQFGEAIGAPVLKPLGGVLGMLNSIAGVGAKVAGSRLGHIGLEAGVLGGGAALFGASRLFRGMAGLSPLAWGTSAATSGPVMAMASGLRGGAGAGAMSETGLLGFFGRRVNSFGARAESTEGPIGGRVMGGANRSIYDFFHGVGSTRGARTSAFADDYEARNGASAASRVFGGVGRGASLGVQGYWRLFSQPFQQSKIPAEDRDWTLTRPGGPGRNLIGGLKGAWSDRDMGAAGQALGDFNKALGGTTQSVMRVGSSFGQAVSDVARYAGGGLLAGGQAVAGTLVRSIGSMLMSPMGLIAGGIGGYELYSKSRNAAQNDTSGSDISQMYSVVNEYRDSLGLAGVAAVDFAQQIKDASSAVAKNVTTYAQARVVTASDVQAWGLPNKKSVPKGQIYTGTGPQIASMINAQYAGVQMTPTDLQGVGRSLYNQGYDAQQIDSILSQVTTGTSTLNNSQIQNLVTHAGHDTTTRTGSTWNNLKQAFAGTILSPGQSTWHTVGKLGGGAPDIGTQGKLALASLSTGIQQTAAANMANGKGAPYTVSTEIAQANKAMNDALATHNANLVVATEQNLTRALTGSAIGNTSAQDVQTDGGLSGLISHKGKTIYGKTIAQWQATPGFNKAVIAASTPNDVTALAGQQGMFGQFYGGGKTGIPGMVTSATGQGVENPAAVSTAADAIVASLAAGSDSLNRIVVAADKSLNTTSGGQNALQLAVMQQAQFRQSTAQIGMTQGQSLAAQTQQNLGLASVNGQDTNSQAQRTAGLQGLQGIQQQETSYYQQRLMAQFNFQIQSERSTQDYDLQQTRSTQDYQLQVTRSEQDFYLQRTRSLQDFNTQTKREVLAASQSAAYNPYTRINVNPVFGASDLEQNLSQQNQALSQQELNLNKVRALGLSGMAIQTLGLAQTANAQQLQQLVDDFANNPQLIQQMNAEINKRTKDTKSLVTDPGDVTYQQQKQDFDRQLLRSKQDFDTQSLRNAQDFQTQEERAAQDFQTSLSRMTQDLHDQDLAATGNMKQLQADMIKILHGQTVDWSKSLNNTLDGTLKDTKKYESKIVASLNQGSAAASAAASSGGSGAAGPSGPGGSRSPQSAGGYNGTAGSSTGGGGAPDVAPAPGASTLNKHDAKMETDTLGNPTTNRELGKILAARLYGWTGSQFNDLDKLWGTYESGWRGTAKNPNSPADGIAQADPPRDGYGVTASEYLRSARAQIEWGLGYINASYGSPSEALRQEMTNFRGFPKQSGHSGPPYGYAKGAIATNPTLGWIAEAGSSEAIIPLNQQGIAFLADSIDQYISNSDAAMITSGGRAMSVTVNNQSYTENYGHHIDTVELKAADPKDMANKLDQIQRAKNLTGLGGVKRRGG